MSKKPEQVDLKVIAAEAAKEAIRMYKDEERKNRKKTVLRNTRVLLEHYTDLKAHKDHAKYKAGDEITIDGGCINIKRSDSEEIYIESIKRSRMVTMIILSHIDKCMELLRIKMINRNQPEKHEVIKRLYFEESQKEWNELLIFIADEMHISESTLRRWEKEMVDELSVYLFGADALRVF